jgi:hypothetical protein
MNNTNCADVNKTPIKFGNDIIISGVIYRPYRNQQKLLTNIIILLLKIIDFDDRSLITFFITDNGDADNNILILQPINPIVSPLDV